MTVCPKCNAENREAGATCVYCGEELKRQRWWENDLLRVFFAVGKGVVIVVAWVIHLLTYGGDSGSSTKNPEAKTSKDQPRQVEHLSTQGSGFQTLVTNADVSIVAEGRDPAECFANAARGMYSVISDANTNQQLEPRQISMTAPDLETLLANWLNELLSLLQVEGVLFTDFTIHTLTDQQLEELTGDTGAVTRRRWHEILLNDVEQAARSPAEAS